MYGGASHPIDLLRWFLGDIVEVHCFSHRSGLSEYPLDEDFVINLRFNGGQIGRVLAAYGVVHPPMPMMGLGIYGRLAAWSRTSPTGLAATSRLSTTSSRRAPRAPSPSRRDRGSLRPRPDGDALPAPLRGLSGGRQAALARRSRRGAVCGCVRGGLGVGPRRPGGTAPSGFLTITDRGTQTGRGDWHSCGSGCCAVTLPIADRRCILARPPSWLDATGMVVQNGAVTAFLSEGGVLKWEDTYI